ncbi:hypothetical protein [Cellulomonas iranensis]|uniref:hypothetical protein n=1 Tax=Cellulomonas iranensis TaxID=76862 RepID=UPI0015C618B4|nr:hypothetical protein [Cellulomonas iranensis]
MTAVTTGSVELDDVLARFADVVVSVSPDVAFAVIAQDLIRHDTDGLPVLPDWHVVVRGDAARVEAFVVALRTVPTGLWLSIEIDDEHDDEDDAPVPYTLTDSAWAVERTAAYSRSQMVGRVAVAVIAFVVFFALGALVAARAVAAGSDGPTPYTVAPTGIAFPTPLAAHGHVNVRLADGRTAGLHLDPNDGHPGARWIGSTFLPWSALGVVDGCVAWVQWSDAPEHYGEGGQRPVCLSTPTPTSTPEPMWTPSQIASPTPSPEPTTSPTPSEPSATRSPSASPVPEPTPGPSTTPTLTPSATPTPTPTPTSSSSPTQGSTATSTPSASPTPTRAPVATTSPSPISPAASPSTPDVVERAEVSAATDDSASGERAEVLAATGTSGQVVFVVGVVLVLVGLALWGIGRGRRGGAR